MKQCPRSAAPGRSYYADYSLLPLPMVGSPIWAVGWHKYRKSSSERLHQSGVWLMNSRLEEPKIGQAQTYKKVSEPRSRTLSRSRVFLTEVDSTQGLDICEIERIEDQNCRRMDRRCNTPERGRETLTHIRMWKPGGETFERYLMSTHKRCDAPFDFAERDAYMLYHRNKRLGIIESPGGEADE